MPELVTGHEGATHVSSDDAGRFNACTLGFDDYLFTLPDGTVPQAVLEDANHVTIPVCDMMIEGRHVRVSSADSVVIESGGAGVKRRDLICIHYTRDSENVEKVVWEVVKGTPGSTVTTPDLPVTASILDMAEDVYVPVFRVDLDGITPSAPLCLLATFTPVQDSLTQMMECGTVSAKTDGSGYLTVKWKSHTSTPKSVVITKIRETTNPEIDLSTYGVVAVLWSVSASSAKVRFRNTVTNAWAGNYGPMAVNWAAFW